MLQTLRALWRDENAATIVEYSLIVAVVAMTMITILNTVGGHLVTNFQNLANALL